MKNTIHAPWRKGTGLSCSVFDSRGGVVASIFAPTHDEQTRRMHLVKAAPTLLAALKTLQEWHTGRAPDYDAPAWEEVERQMQAAINEAEPV